MFFSFLGIGFLKPKIPEISLESLSRLWREDKEDNSPFQSNREEEIFWKNQSIFDFYQAYIKPQVKVLGQGLKALKEVLTLLDLKGECPSVVSGEPVRDETSFSSYELLSRVTLRDHSLNTGREAFGLIKESYPDYEMVLGKTLIAALGHDLGKIPSNRNYLTGYHPIRSAQILESIVKDLPYRNEVLKAVRNHHLKSSDSFTTLIKEADYRARDKELKELEFWVSKKKSTPEIENPKEEKPPGNIPEKLDLPWIVPEEVVELINPYINTYVTRKGELSAAETGYWMAFSFKDGLVYVMPRLLSRIAEKIALDKKERGFTLRLPEAEFKRNVEFTVVAKLREKGFIADTIGEGYVGSRYHLYFKGERKPLLGYYVPFKAETFGDFGQLEEMRKKKGRLAEIERVERVVKSA